MSSVVALLIALKIFPSRKPILMEQHIPNRDLLGYLRYPSPLA